MPGDFQFNPCAPDYVPQNPRELEIQCRALFAEVRDLEYQLDDQKAEQEILNTHIHYFEGLSRELQALTHSKLMNFHNIVVQLQANNIRHSRLILELKMQILRLEAQIDQHAPKLPSPELSSLVRRRNEKAKRASLSRRPQSIMDLKKVTPMLIKSLTGLTERKRCLILESKALDTELTSLNTRLEEMKLNEATRKQTTVYMSSMFGRFEAFYGIHHKFLHEKRDLEKEVVQLQYRMEQLKFQLASMVVPRQSLSADPESQRQRFFMPASDDTLAPRGAASSPKR